MPRPRRKRHVCVEPKTDYFKPVGLPLKELELVVLFFEEFEAIRLKDLEGKEQKAAAEEMNVSQSTFHRILLEGRKKIAKALVQGTAIKIEGGNYLMKEENVVKIAVSSSSNSLNGLIDSRFGRCPYFLIISLKNDEIIRLDVIENLEMNRQGGAGIAAVEQLAKQNIDALITGNIGPRALDVLRQFSIPVYQFDGYVKEAISQFNQKKLKQL